ncbi:MAG: HEAT repeat domain-containing protein [Planctomycetota bacterium]
MSLHQQIYEAVAELESPELDAALAATLPTAEPGLAEQIAPHLVKRGRSVGMRAVLDGFGRLPVRAQDAVVESGVKLAPAIREALGRGRQAACLAAAEIIARGGWMRMSDLLADLGRRGPDRAADAACETLEIFAQRAHSEEALPATRGAAVATALDQLVARPGPHRREGVREAWLSLAPSASPGARSALEDPRHPLTQDLRDALRQGGSPATRSAWLWLLRFDTLRSAAGQGAHQLRQRRPDLLAECWTAHPLLLLGRTRRALKTMRQPLRLSGCDALKDPRAERESALGRVAVLEAAPAPDPARWARWARYAAHESPRVRLAALRRLAAQATPRPTHAMSAEEDPARDTLAKALAAFVGDDKPDLARLAVHALGVLSDRAEAMRALGAAARRSDPTVRRLAEARLAPQAFERLWDGWSKLGPEQRLAAGQAVLKLDTIAHHRLRRRMSRSRGDRMRAIQMVGELGQADFFESVLCQAATGSDTRLASSAIRALGSGTLPSGLEAIAAGLEHDDARVRANAVEALADRGSPMYAGKLEQLSESGAPRCRANAIVARSRLNLARPEKSLRVMLADHRPGCRVSALWAARTLEARGVVSDIAQRAMDDPEPAVRRAAERLLGRWLAELEEPEAPATEATPSLADRPLTHPGAPMEAAA